MSKAARSLKRSNFWATVGVASMASTWVPTAARAYDAPTTSAGLTERAVSASNLHRVLSNRLGRRLGLHASIKLDRSTLGAAQAALLWDQLGALDPESGARPNDDGSASAVAWATAGAILSHVPAERARHHFLEPVSGRGLDNGTGLGKTAHAVRLAFDGGGGLRGLATGTTFDLTGKGALAWVRSDENPLGLPAFERFLEQAVTAETPGARDAGLARALMALGGTLAALEDMGDPAHVRNDFGGASSADRSTPTYGRFVATTFGRTGLPAPATPVTRPSVEAYFTAGDGQGLADRTHRRFFSTGTVPQDLSVPPEMTPSELAAAARDSLMFPSPSVARLELRTPGAHYVRVEGRRALAYERGPRGVHFFLDEGVFHDSAKTLLPEVGAYAAGLVNHVLRAGLTVGGSAGQADIALESATSTTFVNVVVYTEDAAGKRRPVPGQGSGALKAGESLRVAIPAGAVRVAAFARGTDASGTVVAFGEGPVR